jgi:hypothetical protein
MRNEYIGIATFPRVSSIYNYLMDRMSAFGHFDSIINNYIQTVVYVTFLVLVKGI